MDAATIIAILTALGVGSTLSAVVMRALDRKKTQADVTAILNKASGDLVTQYQAINAVQAKDLAGARAEVAAMRAELVGVEGKLDQVLDAVTEERRWATANGHHDAPVLRIVSQ